MGSRNLQGHTGCSRMPSYTSQEEVCDKCHCSLGTRTKHNSTCRAVYSSMCRVKGRRRAIGCKKGLACPRPSQFDAVISCRKSHVGSILVPSSAGFERVPLCEDGSAHHRAVAYRVPPRPRITMISASHNGSGPLRLPGLPFTAAGAACSGAA